MRKDVEDTPTTLQDLCQGPLTQSTPTQKQNLLLQRYLNSLHLLCAFNVPVLSTGSSGALYDDAAENPTLSPSRCRPEHVNSLHSFCVFHPRDLQAPSLTMHQKILHYHPRDDDPARDDKKITKIKRRKSYHYFENDDGLQKLVNFENYIIVVLAFFISCDLAYWGSGRGGTHRMLILIIIHGIFRRHL
jgi:hypothetical protein